jgi:hypothetical protein
MHKRFVLAMIIMTEFVLLTQNVRAQGGSVSESPVSPGILPAPRVRAPLTVLGKPIVAEFQSTRTERPGDGSKSVEIQLQGKFYRDRNGNTRTDYFEPSAGPGSIAVSFVWSPQSKTITLVSFADRTVKRREGPHYPSEGDWLPGGRFVLKPTDDERTIYGLKCKRVSLLPIPPLPIRDQATENLQGETWVAFDWGLVMLDVTEMPTEELRWEVVRVEGIEPDPAVFEVPQGFTMKE